MVAPVLNENFVESASNARFTMGLILVSARFDLNQHLPQKPVSVCAKLCRINSYKHPVDRGNNTKKVVQLRLLWVRCLAVFHDKKAAILREEITVFFGKSAQ
jgi:hypothetical protein